MNSNDELETLRAELTTLVSLGDIQREYGALAAHYPVRELSPDRRERLAKDWIDDLSGFPLKAVAEACRAYRRSGQKFMATSGEIRCRAISISSAMRARVSQIESVEALGPSQPPKCRVFDGASAFGLPMSADEWREFRRCLRNADEHGRSWPIWAPAKIDGTDLVLRDRRGVQAIIESSSDLLRAIGATAVVSASCRYRAEI